MNMTRYLQRIDDSGPLEPSVASLIRLHRAHLLSVPFENLDMKLAFEYFEGGFWRGDNEKNGVSDHFSDFVVTLAVYYEF